MNIDYLIIEITRKCNFSCEHCLRGNAQNKNIDPKIIDTLLDNNNIDYISNVTFTGGEPSLNIEGISYFLKKCKENEIEIGNFYIATNGGSTSGNIDFIKLLIDLYCYCSDNEITLVEVSKSDYHEYQQDNEAIEKLKCLSFVKERNHLDNRYIIAEGKGVECAYGDARKITPEKNLIIEDDNIQNNELYINCNGDICLSCNLSYIRQSRNKIGNIFNDKLINLTKEAILV